MPDDLNHFAAANLSLEPGVFHTERDAFPKISNTEYPRENYLHHWFNEKGADALPDRELLKLVLSRSIPARELSALTEELIYCFGDFNRILSASRHRLAAFQSMTEQAISDLKIMEACAHRMTRARILNQTVLDNWQALLDYCHVTMSHLETEQFRVLFLDSKNAVITDEQQSKGTVDHVPVYPREIVKRALELNACAIILVHNHPSGDPTPSQSDLMMTDQINQACEALGISLHDHLIIGKSREVSFRTEGYL